MHLVLVTKRSFLNRGRPKTSSATTCDNPQSLTLGYTVRAGRSDTARKVLRAARFSARERRARTGKDTGERAEGSRLLVNLVPDSKSEILVYGNNYIINLILATRLLVCCSRGVGFFFLLPAPMEGSGQDAKGTGTYTARGSRGVRARAYRAPCKSQERYISRRGGLS